MSMFHQPAKYQRQNAQFGATKPLVAKPSQKRAFGTVISHNVQADMGTKKGALKVASRKAVPTPSTTTGTGSKSVVASVGMSFQNIQLEQEKPVDVDACDRSNPQCVPDYVNDIFRNFKQAELRGRANPTYMTGQTQITSKMRSILVDWLIEVHMKFKLMPETLFLSVNLIDRFLQMKIVERQKLQLVGVTCMLLASKYEEIYFPEIRDFVYITDKAYTRRQILKMEEIILNVLKFDLTVPTANCFVKRFIKAANLSHNPKLEPMATFISERMMQEYEMIAFRPSVLAAASVSIALNVLGEKSWNATLEHYSGYKVGDLTKCVSKIKSLLVKGQSSSLKAVEKKYASSKFQRVSTDVMHAIRS